MDSSNEEAAYAFAMDLVAGSVLPLVLKSTIELDLLEHIKKAGSASAAELAAQLPTHNPQAASMLDRILHLLSCHSILICNFPDGDGDVERRYSLAPLSKFLTRNEDGVSVAPFLLMTQDSITMDNWYRLKDMVLEGVASFDKARGMNAYEYTTKDLRYHNMFNQAMHERSTIFMKKILEIYKGFEGLNSLVDVGGGTGASLKMIMSKYPSIIKAINFDLPHVIKDAPPHPGIENIGGDMFVSVPKGDAIFMKYICHNWSDLKCEKLLKNCYDALPENGKVIVADIILPEDTKSGVSAARAVRDDVIMLMFNPGGKERTEKEFQALANQAGFNQFIKVCSAYDCWIMEFHK